MPENQFHTHTALANGLRELLRQLEERLSLSRPVNAYLAGYVGGKDMLRLNLRDAVALARQVEAERDGGSTAG